MQLVKDYLIHYGVKRRSGRYPWGSGENPFQHSGDFLSRVEQLAKDGMSEKEIADYIGLSTSELRLQKKLATHMRRQLEAATAKSLREDGLSLQQIAEKMGYKNDSSVRALLREDVSERSNTAFLVAEVLKTELEKTGMVDVGLGAEHRLGVSRGQLDEAVYLLSREGWNVYGVGVANVTNFHKQTTMKVLAKPEVTYAQAINNPGDIALLGEEHHSEDMGQTWKTREYPASIDLSRVKIRYPDEGGDLADGTIEIRRGVDDLNLGASHYAQVRILVDGTHYLKGMAYYSDDIPDGYDIVFNTSKRRDQEVKGDVLKAIKTEDPSNPFGAYIKAEGQSHYIDKNGEEKLSAINKLKEEGDWELSSKNLSSQFLSKQPQKLINQQLELTLNDYKDRYDEIKSITNPVIKQKLLLEFADECDSAVVHMKAAALPRQTTKVILPLPEIGDQEIYAPYYRNGEKVALVRYPHGGTFEIPILTVNNNNPAGKSKFGEIMDAVGISKGTADRLSGADFDGDTVMVIPTGGKVSIKNSKPLKDLEGFDPHTEYAYHEGMKVLPKSQVNKQMGIVSNLITDMTLKGATEQELARAVKHSMVVIDANKHKLDYKRSELENGIEELKETYQRHLDPEGKSKRGASTLLSTRKQEIDVPETRGSGIIDPETGKVVYKQSHRTYVDKKTGEVREATSKVPINQYYDDLHILSSGTPQEEAYANYGNAVKALAAEARIEYKKTPNLQYNPEAKKKYQAEVDRLNSALVVAEANKPKERRAQAIANSKVKAIIQENPELTDKENKKLLTKIKSSAIDDARASVGASGKKTRITISDSEWEAIQNGAISHNKLLTILQYTDVDELAKRALPRTTTTLSPARQAKIDSMRNSGYTLADIADSLGVSVSTVTSYIQSEKKK